MCRINNKIRLFSEFLNLLMERFGMNDFKQLFVYKLHYLMCVDSVSNETGEGNGNGVSMFNVFDNFRALKNGPVEWDIYVNRDIIPGWTYDQNTASFKVDENAPAYENNTNQDELEMLQASVNSLSMKLGLSRNYQPNDDRTIIDLIELTHELKLWKHTFIKYGEQERLLTKSLNNRILEWDALKDKLNANHD